MKFTWDDFFEISQGQKPSNFKPPDWEKVKAVISEKLEICNDEKLHARVVELAIRYGKFVKSKNAKCSSKRLTSCRDIVIDSEDFSSSSAENPSKKQRKSLDQLGDRHLKTRTDDLWRKVEAYAEENNETPLRIVALLLKKCKDKSARDFGDQIWAQPILKAAPHKPKTLPIDAAVAIMVDCQLGRDTYTKLRKIVTQQGHDIFPPWIHIRKRQMEISPKPQLLPEPHEGVQMTYSESMKITAQRIMEDIEPSLIPKSAVMNNKFGFDGSGSHAIYRQLENERTNNIIMSMFCPLSINSESGDLKWMQKSPNSALTHRPLALQLGKESTKTLQSLRYFDDDINSMKSNGCTVMVGEKEVALKLPLLHT